MSWPPLAGSNGEPDRSSPAAPGVANLGGTRSGGYFREQAGIGAGKLIGHDST
jgi:hypothetical protein